MKGLSTATEEQIQRALVEWLQLAGRSDVTWFHPPNGGFRNPAEAGRFKALGVRAGVPDLIFIRGGRVFALELKSKLGKVSAPQREMHLALQRSGAVVAVAWSLEAAMAQLLRWGLTNPYIATGEPHGSRPQRPRKTPRRHAQIPAA